MANSLQPLIPSIDRWIATALLGFATAWSDLAHAEPPEKGAIYPDRMVYPESSTPPLTPLDATEKARRELESECKQDCASRWTSSRLDALLEAKIPVRAEVLLPMKFGNRNAAFVASGEFDPENCRIVPVGDPPFVIAAHRTLRLGYVAPKNRRGIFTAVFFPDGGIKDYRLECRYRAHVGAQYIHKILADRGILDLRWEGAVQARCEQECKVRVVREGESTVPALSPGLSKDARSESAI